jgi:hypothetical protein
MRRRFGDLSAFAEFARRTEVATKRMVDGTLGGRTNLASPVPVTGGSGGAQSVRPVSGVAPVTVHWNNPGGDVDGVWSEFSQMWALPNSDLSWLEFPPSYAPTDLTRIWLTKPGMWLCSLQVGYSSATHEARIEANVAPVCRATEKVTGGGAFIFDQVQIDTSFPEVRVNVDTTDFQTAYMSLTWFPGEPVIQTF